MSTETHINAIKSELTEAVKDAHQALDVAVEKIESYIAKLQTQDTTVTSVEPAAISEPAVSIPTMPPKSSADATSTTKS